MTFLAALLAVLTLDCESLGDVEPLGTRNSNAANPATIALRQITGSLENSLKILNSSLLGVPPNLC
jgi:hypothetical protein